MDDGSSHRVDVLLVVPILQVSHAHIGDDSFALYASYPRTGHLEASSINRFSKDARDRATLIGQIQRIEAWHREHQDVGPEEIVHGNIVNNRHGKRAAGYPEDNAADGYAVDYDA